MKKPSILITALLILQSCVIGDLQKTNKQYSVNKILRNTRDSYLYKCEINIYDNYFSGLIVIKPKETGHRIVFMNEIGMKFFDLELTENSYTIYHIYEAMNKKIFIKLLVSDFKLILLYSIHDKNVFFIDENIETFILKPMRYKELYYCDKEFSLPKKAFRYSIFRKHTFVSYEGYEKTIPGMITLDHKNIKFNMKLRYINQN